MQIAFSLCTHISRQAKHYVKRCNETNNILRRSVFSFFSPLCYLHATGCKNSSLRRTRDSKLLKRVFCFLRCRRADKFVVKRRRSSLDIFTSAQTATYFSHKRKLAGIVHRKRGVKSLELTPSLKNRHRLCADGTYTRRFICM